MQTARNFESKKDRDLYCIYRQRIEEFLHLFLLWDAMLAGGSVPNNVMGHEAEHFANTLRTATLGWLASLVDEHKSALNVFDLWLKIFPERQADIVKVRDEIRPHLKLLIEFRNKTAFHANKSLDQHRKVRKALQNPAMSTATQSFLALCIDLLKNDHYGEAISGC